MLGTRNASMAEIQIHEEENKHKEKYEAEDALNEKSMTVDDMAATIYALSNEAKSHREVSKSHRGENEEVDQRRVSQDEDMAIQSMNGTDAPSSALAKRND